MQSVTVLGFDPQNAGCELSVLLSALSPHHADIRWLVANGSEVSALGDGHRDLADLAQSRKRISSASLIRIAGNIEQVISGEFHGYCDTHLYMPWIVISIFEGTLEIHSVDERIIDEVRNFFGESRTELGRSNVLERMLPRRH
jgi:hypothetical protein